MNRREHEHEPDNDCKRADRVWFALSLAGLAGWLWLDGFLTILDQVP